MKICWQCPVTFLKSDGTESVNNSLARINKRAVKIRILMLRTIYIMVPCCILHFFISLIIAEHLLNLYCKL